MKALIPLKEVLERLDRLDEHGDPTPCDLLCVTADRARGTGGKLLELKGGILAKHAKGVSKTFSGGIASNRKQNHWKNATRNIMLPNGEVRKVHIRLLLEFNGKEIHY